MNRKQFIRNGLLLSIMPLTRLFAGSFRLQDPVVMTVTGPVPPQNLGFTLVHEHVMVDFIGLQHLMPAPLLSKDAFAKSLPFLQELARQGCQTLVDCTPAGLGRDVRLLKELATEIGLRIITPTGYYGAVGEKYLPRHIYTLSAEKLAEEWIREWEAGIEGTGIRPGFIKSGVDKAPLSEVQRKLVEAACITHLRTGLSFAIHTGDGAAALEELTIIERSNVSPEAWIWTHAQNESDRNIHLTVARKGGWISYDGLNDNNVPAYVQFVKEMKAEGLLHKILISHDAGWYEIGREHGGNFRPYTTVKTHLVPALQKAGISEEDIQQIFVYNPAKALSVYKKPHI